jgi:hypothetical protein
MLALVGCVTGSGLPPSPPFSFALLGDAPYEVADEQRFAAMLRQIDDDPSLRFVLHVGDLKGSGESCSDALLRRRLAQLRSLRKAVVYTPGDNEWADCHRAAAGRFHPLERLAALRRIAFADAGRSLGQAPLPVQSQARSSKHHEFAENLLFVHGGVVFVTLHVVGSNNGLEPWRGTDAVDSRQAPRADQRAAFAQRQSANLDWLKAAFERAEAVGAAGIVVLMQANPRFDLPAGHPERAGFEALIAALHRQATPFRRPVLLAHGDRHVFQVDEPLAEAMPPAPNLLRVQTHGHPWIGWVRVTVDRRRRDLFEVRHGGFAPAQP